MRSGNTAGFEPLSPDEVAFIEMKMGLARNIRARRLFQELISHSFANCSGGIVGMAGPGEIVVIAPANVCGGH
jgi:hypothetical protein